MSNDCMFMQRKITGLIEEWGKSDVKLYLSSVDPDKLGRRIPSGNMGNVPMGATFWRLILLTTSRCGHDGR